MAGLNVLLFVAIACDATVTPDARVKLFIMPRSVPLVEESLALPHILTTNDALLGIWLALLLYIVQVDPTNAPA